MKHLFDSHHCNIKHPLQPKTTLGFAGHDRSHRAHTHQLALQQKRNSCVSNDHWPGHYLCEPPVVASRNHHPKGWMLPDLSCGGGGTAPLVSTDKDYVFVSFRQVASQETTCVSCITTMMTYVEQRTHDATVWAHHFKHRSCLAAMDVFTGLLFSKSSRDAHRSTYLLLALTLHSSAVRIRSAGKIVACLIATRYSTSS